MAGASECLPHIFMPLTDSYASTVYSGSQGTTNNTTSVIVVPNPGTGQPVFVVPPEHLAVLNRDTVSQTIIVTLTAPSTIVDRVTLATGDRWTNPASIIVGPGQTLTVELAGFVTTNQLTYNSAFFYLTD